MGDSSFRFLAILMMIAGSVSVSPAIAMDFTLTRELGAEVDGHVFPDIIAIAASGAIEDGDAGKLADILPLAERDQFGNVRVYLDSPGGSVNEALKIVSVMDKYEVTAVVADRAHCLSACASIIFLSARIHLMIGSAELGLHTCRIGPGLVSPECNNLLSSGTLNRGTDFGATESFLKAGADSPEEMIYFDWRAAALWGLLGPPTYDPTLALPTFDCDQPRSALQRITCLDLRLSRYEASYARSMRALAKLKGQGRSQFESQLRSSLEEIAERCKTSAGCLLSEFGRARKAVRMEIGQRSLDGLLRNIDSQKQRDFVLSVVAKCNIPSTCGRVDLLDAPFEFAQANFANLFAMQLLARAKGETPSRGFSDPKVGTSDCVFSDLCDPRIKTINWLWFSDAVARKIPRSQIVQFIDDRRAAMPPQELQ